MQNKTVLIVEDHSDTRHIYGIILQHSGYGVLEAENGLVGCEVARTKRPDLILMDLNMPVLSGWDATHRLRHDHTTAQIPIVAVTALDCAEIGAEPKRAGFDGYLRKPVHARDLINEVARYIGPARA